MLKSLFKTEQIIGFLKQANVTEAVEVLLSIKELTHLRCVAVALIHARIHGGTSPGLTGSARM